MRKPQNLFANPLQNLSDNPTRDVGKYPLYVRWCCTSSFVSVQSVYHFALFSHVIVAISSNHKEKLPYNGKINDEVVRNG